FYFGRSTAASNERGDVSSATEGSDAREGGPQDEEAELPSILAGDRAAVGFYFGRSTAASNERGDVSSATEGSDARKGGPQDEEAELL
ncbi:MAG: hypothetical protein IJY17_00095, partial [Alphaproteobacteria bacterium]|nr:hypothetical protein [Alphaproteobacteria bacterium]